MNITSISKDSHEISFDVPRANWEKWFLLSSDRHHDNAHTNWDLDFMLVIIMIQ